MSNITELDKLYINQCASEEMQYTFTSLWMFMNHIFMFAIIVASYYVSFRAIMKLRNQNIFPDCTRILLFTAVFNGLIHQGTMASIRITAAYSAILYRNKPCSIQFQSSDCFIQMVIYYHTNLFSSLCCISLFFDRVLSRNSKSFYYLHQELFSIIYIFLQITIPVGILFWIFGDSDYTGYVPMCNYPPANASEKFYFVSWCRFILLFFILIASLIMHVNNKRREKRMVHNVYNTESRYKSYENFLATKAVCIIILSQVLCLVTTSVIPVVFKKYQSVIPFVFYHVVVAFQAGLTYANFLVPIIIWYQTDQITKRRHVMINKLKELKESANDHFASLNAYWK